MYKTHVKPSRELRNEYAKMAEILKGHDQIIITNRGRGEAVLINIEDYADYEEYLHRRYVREKLAEAEATAGEKGAWLNPKEFWKGLE